MDMEVINELNSGDYITIELFGKEQDVEVFSTGDNRFDEEGDDKEEGFPLSEEELVCLDWLLENVRIEDYRKEIAQYCNGQYQAVGGPRIEGADVEQEIQIFAIAVNISEITQSNDGFVYPEISFYGSCECDPEHGICIGFRDKKFLGIHEQDWTL